MTLKREYKAAGFAILSIILFIWGFNFLKGKDLLKSYREFYAVFDNVEGIDNSTPVKMRGLVIGSIKDMRFRERDRKIVLTLNIDKSYSIPKDSRIKISGNGILGSRNLELEPGHSPEQARSGDTLQSATAGGFSEMLGSAQEQLEALIVNTNSLIQNLNHVFDDQNRENLKKSLENLRLMSNDLTRLTRQTNALIAANRSRIDQTLTNLQQSSGDMKQITERLSKTDFEVLVKNLTESSEKLNLILQNLQQGKGTAGKLMKDEELYDQLNQTLQNLDALLRDLKAHPKRYVHFSVFGRKDKQVKD